MINSVELKKRMAFAKKAESYIGTKKDSELHHKMVDYWNGTIPIPDNHKMTYNDNWCCLFITFVADMLGWSHIFPRTWSCNRLYETAYNFTPWEDFYFRPVVGDILLYDWGEMEGPKHAGIIVARDVENVLYVVEGDYKHSVSQREINMYDTRLFGSVELNWIDYPPVLMNDNIDDYII